MKRPFILCAAILTAVLGGCAAETNSPGTSKTPIGKIPGAEDSPSDPKHMILFVMLRMVTFEVPLGEASESEQIWSYLEEEPLAVQRGVSLGRNGIRIGVGRNENWPDLAQVLKRMTGRRVRETTVTLLPGNPTSIELKGKQPTQTIFTFHEDRTLSGADYPPGDNVLGVVCTLDEDDQSVIRITGVPQIRSSRAAPKVVKNQGNIMIADKRALYDLHPLTFQVSVPSKDFIVIGPNAASRRQWSVGRAFLLTDKGGVPFETVQLVMPEVYAAPTRINTTP